MNTYAKPTSEELCHHGILGMRWGIRRTKAQLGYDTSSKKKKKRVVDDDVVYEGFSKKKKKVSDDNSYSSSKSGKSSKKNIDEMTDEELKSYIERNRLNNEALRSSVEALNYQKQYNQLYNELNPKDVSKGKQFLASVGKNVVGPAMQNVGKDVLQKWLNKKLSESIGVGDTKDAYSALKKEVDTLELKKKKAQAEDFFENRNKKKNDNQSEDQIKNNKSKEDNPKNDKKNDDTEHIKNVEIVDDGSGKKSSSKTKNSYDDIIIDVESEEVKDFTNSDVKTTGENYYLTLYEKRR